MRGRVDIARGSSDRWAREGRAEAFAGMAAAGDDALLPIEEDLSEWEWPKFGGQ